MSEAVREWSREECSISSVTDMGWNGGQEEEGKEEEEETEECKKVKKAKIWWQEEGEVKQKVNREEEDEDEKAEEWKKVKKGENEVGRKGKGKES